MMEKIRIKEFYDVFMESRMIHCRLHGSKRLDVASESVTPLVAADSVVRDVCCGTVVLGVRLGRVADRRPWFTHSGVRLRMERVDKTER